jgi:hypothetical protein
MARLTRHSLRDINVKAYIKCVIFKIVAGTALIFLAGCESRIAEKDLSFLDTQKKPLTYQAVAKRLGHSEPGSGPYYTYQVRGAKKTVEFWFGPPPIASQASTGPIRSRLRLS